MTSKHWSRRRTFAANAETPRCPENGVRRGHAWRVFVSLFGGPSWMKTAVSTVVVVFNDGNPRAASFAAHEKHEGVFNEGRQVGRELISRALDPSVV